MSTGVDAVSRELSEVAAAVGGHVLDVTHDIWQLVTTDIPELRGDDIVEKLLDSSIEENVATLLHVFEHGSPPDGASTSSALDPRTLASRLPSRRAWPMSASAISTGSPKK
jgi:hypothetical protein